MDSGRILDAISRPQDLRVLSVDELEILAQEIREEIINVTSRTGGHIAPSLGATDIIVALHSMLDCPKDRILFDVGHQAYAHKLVTGRLEGFQNLRQYGGVSGFPKPSESEYDVHPSGHASDSLSIALGLAKARDMRGTDEKIAVVIGDASIAGGMAFEALNHIGQTKTQMLIILNDNEMSISRNVGALMRHFGRMRASSQYREGRDAIQERMEQSGKLGRAMVDLGRNMKDSMKQMFLQESMIYENLGIVCTAPVDGHNIAALREQLKSTLAMDTPVIMHVVTQKGKGYQPAIDNLEKFHGVGPFDVKTGNPVKKPGPPTFTEVFGQAMVAEAKRNPNLVALTAAMKSGTGLSKFAELYPSQFVDTGITEGHAAGLAAGIAAGGKKPVFAVYSTFLQRAIDQMIINAALPNWDVVFAVDRAGLVGEDGPTHHGVFDLAYSRMIPGMRVLAPSDEAELVHALHTAIEGKGPFVVRYPRGAASGVPIPDEPQVLEPGVSRVVRDGADATILSFGHLLPQAMEAAGILAEEGLDIRVVDMRWVKPLDKDAVRAAAKTPLIVTLECGTLMGGAGSAVLEAANDMGLDVPILRLGVPDDFVTQGSLAQLYRDLSLDAEGIARLLRQVLS